MSQNEQGLVYLQKDKKEFKMNKEEQLERELISLYSLLTTSAWTLEGLVLSEDPKQALEKDKEVLELLLDSCSVILEHLADQYIKTYRQYAKEDANIAIWVKEKGLAVDVTYWCQRCKNNDVCRANGMKMKNNSIDECFDRRLTRLDN